jgi:hypothetical protein
MSIASTSADNQTRLVGVYGCNDPFSIWTEKISCDIFLQTSGNPNKLTASVPMEDYVYVVTGYLQYVHNSYLKEVIVSTMVKRYGSSYRFNVARLKEIDISYTRNRHLPNVRNYENRLQMFRNNKKFYEPFVATPFRIYLNDLADSMSNKLKIYKGTIKIPAPKTCHFCLQTL